MDQLLSDSFNITVIIDYILTTKTIRKRIKHDNIFPNFINSIQSEIQCKEIDSLLYRVPVYKLNNIMKIDPKDERSLKQLGFQDDSILYIFFKRRPIDINIFIYKGEVIYQHKIQIDPDVAFNKFIEPIKDLISFQIWNEQHKYRITYTNEYDKIIDEYETTSLLQLNLTHNSIINVKLQLSSDIIITIIVNQQQETLFEFNISNNQGTPFNQFLEEIKQQIFTKIDKSLFQDKVIYQLVGNNVINPEETKSLYALGFKNNCFLEVRLQLKQN